MKKLLSFTGVLGLIWGNVLALNKEPLRAENSVVVKNGQILTTGILSDIDGNIFLEFLKDMHVNVSATPVGFQGEIIAPTIIEIPQRAPRGRMKEVLTFELLTNSGEEITFVDRFAFMHPKDKRKAQIENPELAIQRSGTLLLTKFTEEDNVRKPALWEYRNETNDLEGSCDTKTGEIRQLCFQLKECKRQDDFEKEKCIKKLSWRKIGGKIETTPEEDTVIFSALLTRNGTFTIFDENPTAEFTPTFPISEVERVDQSPFPSVEPPPLQETETTNEAFIDLEEEDEEDDLLTIIPTVGDTDTLVIPSLEDLSTEGIPPFIEEDEDTEIAPSPSEPIEETIITSAKKETEQREAEQAAIEALNQTNIPKNATLPKSGQNKNYKFPLTLILTLSILGASSYLALKNKPY